MDVKFRGKEYTLQYSTEEELLKGEMEALTLKFNEKEKNSYIGFAVNFVKFLSKENLAFPEIDNDYLMRKANEFYPDGGKQ